MEYAVISLANQQFYVKPGSKFSVLGILGQPGEIISSAQVLLYKDGQLDIGNPVTKHTVDLKVVTHNQTDKVDIFKYKSKSRYRRHTGHRQGQTVLEVVTAAKAKVAPVKKAPVKAKAKPAKEK